LCVCGDLQGEVWMHEGIDEHTTSSTTSRHALHLKLTAACC
jgi:hypothetical protein